MPKFRLENPESLALLIIVIFTLTIGVGSFRYHKIGGWGVETDFYWDFAPAAQELQRLEFHVGHYQFRGVGYPLMLALVDLFIPDTVDAARILGLLSAALTLWLAFLIVKGFLDAWWGVWIVVALTLNPVFIEYSYIFGTDMPFLALTTLFLWIITRAKLKYGFYLAGLIAAFAFLTRYNGAAYLLIGLIWAFFSKLESNHARIKIVTKYLLGASVLLIPWFLLLAIKTGNPLFNLNYQNIAYELYGHDKMTWDQFWYNPDGGGVRSLADLIRNDFWTLAGNFFYNIYDHTIQDAKNLLGPVMWVCASGGLLLVLIRDTRLERHIWVPLTGVVSFLLLCLVFYSERFTMCILPANLFMASVFFNSAIIPGNWKWWRWSIKPGMALAFIIVFGTAHSSMTKGVANLKPVPLEILDFTAQPELQTLPRGKLTDRKPHAAYYLGQQFVPLPNYPTLSEVVDWMREQGVDYLFLHEGIAFTRPRMYALFKQPDSVDGLSLIKMKNDKPRCGLWRLTDIDETTEEIPLSD